MTIRTNINARQLSEKLSLFEACVENSPEGTFVDAKEIHQVIGGHADSLIRELKALGLNVCNSDGIREVEAVIYGWAKKRNEDRFHQAEGFGEHFNAGYDNKIVAGLERDRDFLRSIGAIK